MLKKVKRLLPISEIAKYCLMVFIKKHILLTWFLLLGCSENYSYNTNAIIKGAYKSKSGYSLHLNQETYSLCLDEVCWSGEVYQSNSASAIYLLNFREKIPKSDERFTIMLGLDFITAGGGLQGWETTPRKLDNDVQVRWQNDFHRCKTKPCFLLGIKEHDGYDYLFIQNSSS